MKKFRTVLALIAFVILTGIAPVSAQGDKASGSTSTAMATTTADSSDGTKHSDGPGKYMWVVVMAVIVAGIGAAYVFRGKRKKGDDEPQTGGEINNPASGI